MRRQTRRQLRAALEVERTRADVAYRRLARLTGQCDCPPHLVKAIIEAPEPGTVLTLDVDGYEALVVVGPCAESTCVVWDAICETIASRSLLEETTPPFSPMDFPAGLRAVGGLRRTGVTVHVASYLHPPLAHATALLALRQARLLGWQMTPGPQCARADRDASQPRWKRVLASCAAGVVISLLAASFTSGLTHRRRPVSTPIGVQPNASASSPALEPDRVPSGHGSPATTGSAYIPDTDGDGDTALAAAPAPAGMTAARSGPLPVPSPDRWEPAH